LENKKIKISKIATGVPIGTDMEYIDSLTLELAIDERKNMN
jgi:recombination protein RecR